VNKAELIDGLAAHAGIQKTEAARAVDALFGPGGIIARELRAGRKVQITGFGTFLVRQRAARTGRNPQTGATITIAAAAQPVFKPGQGLRDVLNPPH
jgi:DNA-binding protein HU-beta